MKPYAFTVGAMFVFGVGAVSASTPQLSITSTTVTQGSEATVDLAISGLGGGTALGTFDLNVAFNPALLGFASATYGDPKLGDQLNLESLGTVTTTTPGTGTVEVFELSLDSPSVLTSSQAQAFTLAKLDFNTVGIGTSNLLLSVNALGDQNGNSLTVAVGSGSVTVTKSTSVPESGTLGLLGLGLAVLQFVRRYRNCGGNGQAL